MTEKDKIGCPNCNSSWSRSEALEVYYCWVCDLWRDTTRSYPPSESITLILERRIDELERRINATLE